MGKARATHVEMNWPVCKARVWIAPSYDDVAPHMITGSSGRSVSMVHVPGFRTARMGGILARG